MSKPVLFVGVGTEVVTQVMLPTCRAIMDARQSQWPDDCFVWMADSDRRAQNRHREAKLAKAQAAYTHLSIHQVREAISRNPAAFKDAWREEWKPLLREAPDNGASALPVLGRLMLKAARDSLMHQFGEYKRQMEALDAGPPEIFAVLNPLAGTSRGSVYELPRTLRAVWPGATIHALVIYPLGLERLDRQRASIFQSSFVEALRILEHYATPRPFEVYLDPQIGWEKREGQLIDNIICFDGRYGNQRLKQLDMREHQLRGGVSDAMGQVADLLSGVALKDSLTDTILSRLADVTMQRSRAMVAGHRTHYHALHQTRLTVDTEAFRKALLERGIQRVLDAFMRSPQQDNTGA